MTAPAELEALLARVSQVLRGARATPPARARVGEARLVAGADAVFYRMGVADRADGDRVAIASLALEAPGARTRELLVALWEARDRIVLATRWTPGEDRPLLRRGEPRAAAWSEDALERALGERLALGRDRFDSDVRDGRAHLDSSGDLLSLPED